MTPTRRPDGNASAGRPHRLTVHAPRLPLMDIEQEQRAVVALAALLIPVARAEYITGRDPLDIAREIEPSSVYADQ